MTWNASAPFPRLPSLRKEPYPPTSKTEESASKVWVNRGSKNSSRLSKRQLANSSTAPFSSLSLPLGPSSRFTLAHHGLRARTNGQRSHDLHIGFDFCRAGSSIVFYGLLGGEFRFDIFRFLSGAGLRFGSFEPKDIIGVKAAHAAILVVFVGTSNSPA